MAVLAGASWWDPAADCIRGAATGRIIEMSDWTDREKGVRGGKDRQPASLAKVKTELNDPRSHHEPTEKLKTLKSR